MTPELQLKVMMLIQSKEEREAFVFNVEYLPDFFFGKLVHSLGLILTSDALINSRIA